MHTMILLGKGAQVEAQFALFGDSANLDARLLHGFHGTYHMLINLFECIAIELLDNMCHMESRFGAFGDRVSFGAR